MPVSSTSKTYTLGSSNYIFTPNTTVPGQECAVNGTLTVNVSTPTTPTFTQIADMCEGFSPAPVLPTTSIQGVTGTWSPSPTIDTSIVGSTIYTFTPNLGQCAIGTTMKINIIPLPVADLLSPVNACDSYTLLPLTSGNYYTLPNGQGAQLSAGRTISSSQTVYISLNFCTHLKVCTNS